MTLVQLTRLILRHPIDFFHEIKNSDHLKWSHGLLLILLTYLARMISLIIVGYHFETRETYEISYVHEFVWIFVPWITWCMANWSVSSILDGEGKFKEIVVGSAFCLTPYILLVIPITLLTNVFSLSESGVYNLLFSFMVAWVILLILIKLKVLHDLELGKLTLILFLTIIAVGIIWFIGILLYGLLNQFISFFLNIFKELRLRF